jgi:hypothetical protein
MTRKFLLGLLLCLTLAGSMSPLSAQVQLSTLGGLVGWTVVADTNIQGEFEGPDYDKIVQLANGWIIQFHDYDYFYEVDPEIVIFAKDYKSSILYRVLVDGGDDIYDVTRIR